MASICVRLCFICVSILYFVQVEGISANEDSRYYYYPGLYKDKSQSTPLLTEFEGLEKETRSRRYVNGPISKLADSYSQRKIKFYSNPQSLGSEHVSRNAESPTIKGSNSSDASVQSLPTADTHDNRVHTNVSQVPLPAQVNNTKPPVNPTLNTSTIVSADFDSTLSSTIVPTIEDELPISKQTDEVIDNVMHQNNLTSRKEDNHLFYNSSFIVDSNIGQSFWVDMTDRSDVITNGMLSQSHRRAATVKLMFDFPFYGHLVRNVTIATGGFLYTGDYVHAWLAATQYIAPLMANFDTSISKGSYIKYVDNGTSFTVQWEKVVLQDKPDSGDFTFQATLHANGDIVFVYQNIPVEIENIQDDQHPVKVGLSDAYIIDRTIFFVRRKTIYEYHRVNFKKEDIKNWTTIYLKALPTCLDKKDCESCLTQDIGFECTWCPEASRCSTGMDRMRQDWLHKECDKIETGNITSCNQPDPKHSHQTSADSSVRAGLQVISDDDKSSEEARMGMSGFLGGLFLIVLLCGVGIWTLYAYNNPHSSSGQILIKYRPNQWSWRRGEARYTAATIHM